MFTFRGANETEYSVSSCQISDEDNESFDSFSEYDSDEKDEIEKNFKENCRLEPKIFENESSIIGSTPAKNLESGPTVM